MKIIWSPAVTLDGYIAKVNGDTSWVADKDGELWHKLMGQVGCYIVGRTTFERDRGQFSNIPGNPKGYIWTKHSETGKHEPQVEYIGGSPESVLGKLERDGFTEAVLVGGGVTNDAFVATGMVNEIFVTIYPMTFGEGIRLLSETNELKLELLESKEIGDGIIRNHYRVK